MENKKLLILATMFISFSFIAIGMFFFIGGSQVFAGLVTENLNTTTENVKIYDACVIGDSCTCAGSGNDWAINMTDYCIISDACNLGTGKLTFTDAGNCTINNTLNTTNMGKPSTDSILYIGSEGAITVN